MTYSSNSIDDYVAKLLPEWGYACDVGANDGKFYSNSLLLEEKGWLVLCVEANPLLEAEGRSNRKLWRAVGASDADGQRRFYCHGGPPYASASGFNIVGGQQFDVPCLRLDRLLEEAGFPRLDFLTIDVELHEPEVLAGFTVERWKPLIIVVEDQSGATTTSIEGYEAVHRMEYDNVFKRLP